MQINFFEKETGSDLERIGIDFSFLSLFSNLTLKKQHKILLAYLKAMQAALHPDHNPDFTASEKERVTKLFSKLNELKDLDKFKKQLEIFRSDKSNYVSSINEISRERKLFAEKWKRASEQVSALQKKNNKLVSEIRELKQNQVKPNPK